MAAAHLTEVNERHCHDRMIIVKNVKPTYRWEEQEAVKKLSKNSCMMFL